MKNSVLIFSLIFGFLFMFSCGDDSKKDDDNGIDDDGSSIADNDNEQDTETTDKDAGGETGEDKDTGGETQDEDNTDPTDNDNDDVFGKEGGPCTDEGTCDEGLECDEFNKCIKKSTVPGEEGGPCDDNGNCNAGLYCMSDDICKRKDNNCNLACGSVTYKDAKTWGDTLSDDAKYVASTPDRVYVAGSISGKVDLNPGAEEDITGDSSSYKDGREYISVYDKNQNYISGYMVVDTGANVFDLKSDSEGNVYVLGTVGTGTNNFNFIDNSNEITIPNDNKTSVFLTKIKSDGSYGWTHIISGESREEGMSLSFDHEQNVFIGGHFYGYKTSHNRKINFDFTGSGDEYSNEADNTVFITKLGSDGSYKWTKLFGEAGEKNEIIAISVDESGIYMAANYSEEIKLSDSITLTKQNDDYRPFVAKLDHSGNVVWAESTGNLNHIKVQAGILYGAFTGGSLVMWDGSNGDIKEEITFGQGLTDPLDIIIDGEDIYLRGYFQGDADFNPHPTTQDWEYNSSEQKQFVTKFKTNGCYCWTETFAKEGINHYWSSMSKTGDNFYMVGEFSYDVNPWSDTISSVDGSSDAIFIHWEIK
jgi:hypothetical protein